MKKLFALLLAAAMLLSMAACCLPTDRLTDDLLPPGVGATKPTFALGTTDGLNYESAFIGIGCNLESGWSFASDEELRELNNIVEDVLDEDLAAALEKADVVYDMMATSGDSTQNVVVTMEKVNSIQLATLDIARNFEILYPKVESSFKNMGYTNIQHSIEPITVDGKEVDALIITASVYGQKIYQTTFCVKCNGYLASIAVTSMSSDATDQLLGNFYWVD